MVMLVIKKSLAILLIVIVVLLADVVTIYTTSTRLREALGNSVDGALVFNMDNTAMAHSDADTIVEMSRRYFYDVLKEELALGDNLKNNTFFRNGVRVDHLHVGWQHDYPVVRAQLSTRVDTVILGELIMPAYAEVRIDNFDHLYWQWADIN